MKRITAIAALVFFFSFGVPSGIAQTEGDYGSIARSMETFGAAFREISAEYVDATDPDAIIAAGIRGMLDELDPFSSYIRSSDDDDISEMANSQYVGFGFTVQRKSGKLFIRNIRKGFPAAEAGVRVGDRIISIDGNIVDTLQVDSLRPYTRGAAGTQSRFTFFREGKADTIAVMLTRATIPIECVTLAMRLPDDVCYIELSRFARSAERDLRAALANLRSEGPIKGIILDLRGNPGGLLDAAIGVADVFLAPGTPIVATVDRYNHRKEYSASKESPEFETPLIVLVDSKSASASEIVAAAIQDNDRGLILGETSFGKGLVQTVIGLPHDASLKLTTARYYSPTGRCIQRHIRQDPKQTNHQPFVTKTGRVVRASSGVVPDSIIKDPAYPPAILRLVQRDVVSQFATQWAANKTSLPKGYKPDNQLFEEFLRYSAQRKPADRSEVLATLVSGKEQTASGRNSESTQKAIDAAIKAAERDFDKAARAQSALVLKLLDAEIQARFSADDARARRVLPLDPVVRIAKDLIMVGNFTTFFGDWSEENQ